MIIDHSRRKLFGNFENKYFQNRFKFILKSMCEYSLLNVFIFLTGRILIFKFKNSILNFQNIRILAGKSVSPRGPSSGSLVCV